MRDMQLFLIMNNHLLVVLYLYRKNRDEKQKIFGT